VLSVSLPGVLWRKNGACAQFETETSRGLYRRIKGVMVLGLPRM